MSVFILSHPLARDRALREVKQAPDGYWVKVEPAKRTPSQNDLFHAVCAAIAKSDATWAGKRRTKDQWKVLMVSGHAVATKEGAEIVPGLEGEFVNIRESTASMSKTRGASLIEYTLAWAARNGIDVESHSGSRETATA
jgi:NinB protein